MSVTIISECGINWKTFNEAKLMALESKRCGADIVKYQTHFNWEYPMLNKAEWKELKQCCDLIGITFMSTAWSFEAIDFLAEIGMTHWKIPSSEYDNKEYVKKIMLKNYDFNNNFKSLHGNNRIFISNGLREHSHTVLLWKLEKLYCISKYPTLLNEIAFELVHDGYSDHTNGILAPIIAVTHGADVIEKHFCLSHPCIDDAVSITPDKFKEMVDVIRQLENYKEPIIPPEILALKNRVQS